MYVQVHVHVRGYLSVEQNPDVGQGFQLDSDYRRRVVVELVYEVRLAGKCDHLDADGFLALRSFPTESTNALSYVESVLLI